MFSSQPSTTTDTPGKALALPRRQRFVAAVRRIIARGAQRSIARSVGAVSNDAGMSTIEYAMGSLAAAALAGVLYAVIQGGAVMDAIQGIITDALSNSPS